MDLKDIQTKCYILALFIRSDGERFVLGSGFYEFIEKQMHFVANTLANDVIEVQGNDGYFLAGQVRRPRAQSFDGYVGDGTLTKEQIEEKRREFFKFFRKNFFYKVVYVFPDGTAIQRKQGFLVDDPSVEELYQIYPKYHVALNFEDVNYYTYSENDLGEEIYSSVVTIPSAMGEASGGLVWDENGAVSEPASFSDNLFDPTNVNVISGNLPAANGSITASTTDRIAYVKVEPNTLYTFKQNLSTPYPRCYIAFSTVEPVVGGAYTNRVQYADGEGSFTTGENTQYLVWWFFNTSSTTYTMQELLNSMELKKLVVSNGAGLVWEGGGSGEPVVVSVNSIENVFPVWEVVGPAVNPSLSVLTTNTTIEYNGTVTAGQTLMIDMFNKTASISGTSVIGNVSGDWVYFEPGQNRVVYVADNPDVPASQIHFQEIVG